MPSHQVVGPSLVHSGTQLSAIVVRAPELATAMPLARGGAKFVLLVASERRNVALPEQQARLWLNEGAAFVCAWGICSDAVEEVFDHAAYSPELGEPLSFTLMTTSHSDESLEEALWFAFYTAFAPDDLKHKLSSVVVLVDSASLEARCTKWIKTNRE
jgi:hypothetical protein